MERTAPIWVYSKLNPNSAVDHGVEAVDVGAGGGAGVVEAVEHGVENPFPLHWQSYLQEEEVPSELN